MLRLYCSPIFNKVYKPHPLALESVYTHSIIVAPLLMASPSRYNERFATLPQMIECAPNKMVLVALIIDISITILFPVRCYLQPHILPMAVADLLGLNV